MPLPLLFIGAGVAAGLFGAGKTTKAALDNSTANKINDRANSSIEEAKESLEYKRKAVQTSLEQLGEEKLDVLNTSVAAFLDTFEKIKNVDFTSSAGLEELKNLHIDKRDFEELKELGHFAANVAGGVAAGAAGGTMAAFGAWGAATTLAAASTRIAAQRHGSVFGDDGVHRPGRGKRHAPAHGAAGDGNDLQSRILEARNGGHHMLGHHAVGGQRVVDIGQHAQQIPGNRQFRQRAQKFLAHNKLSMHCKRRPNLAQPIGGTPSKGRPAARASSPSGEAREGEGAKRLRE